MYTLPNRKAFSDSVTRIFLKYRQKDALGTDEPTERLEAIPKVQFETTYLSKHLIEVYSCIMDWDRVKHQVSNCDRRIFNVNQQDLCSDTGVA